VVILHDGHILAERCAPGYGHKDAADRLVGHQIGHQRADRRGGQAHRVGMAHDRYEDIDGVARLVAGAIAAEAK
jgi:hypothetical protein